MRKLKSFRENKSEYYYKNLIVEPRQNIVFKTYSAPFDFKSMPKKYLAREQSKPPSRHNSSVGNVLANKAADDLDMFRDWVEES